jgi:hypothetical protein
MMLTSTPLHQPHRTLPTVLILEQRISANVAALLEAE